jgi:hypothetical protein
MTHPGVYYLRRLSMKRWHVSHEAATEGDSGANYAIWRKNLDEPAGGGSIANRAVPEPATSVSLIFGAVLRGRMRPRVTYRVS